MAVEGMLDLVLQCTPLSQTIIMHPWIAASLSPYNHVPQCSTNVFLLELFVSMRLSIFKNSFM